MGGVETGGRRRRRTPEVAEAEIVGAAEALLRERSFRELTVDEVMRRTDLSRPSFYVYFRDRHHLMLKVVEHIGAELRTMSQRWYTGSGIYRPVWLEVRESNARARALYLREGFSEAGCSRNTPQTSQISRLSRATRRFRKLAGNCEPQLPHVSSTTTARLRLPWAIWPP